MVCENYKSEVAFLLSSGDFDEMEFATFPANCGHPPIDWNSFQATPGLSQNPEDEFHIFGGTCLVPLNTPPDQAVSYNLHRMQQCFYLLLNPQIVDYFIQDGAYLVSPGWVKNWQQHLSEWGFDQATAREFFGETTQKLVLLDSGIDPQVQEYLRELASHLNLPYETFPVGLDNLKMILKNLQTEWHLAQLRQSTQESISSLNRQRADYAMIFDLINRLSGLMDENKVVENIIELFSMLFAPGKICYVPIHKESPDNGLFCMETPEDAQPLQDWMLLSDKDYAWTENSDGFRLRITYQDETLGALEIQQIAFPSHKEEYLALALAITNICGMAISNARSYQRLEEAREVLRFERDNAQRYLDIADVIFLVIDQNHNVGLINRKGCEILGYAEADILGKNWVDTFLPDGKRNEVSEFFQLAITNKSNEKTYYESLVVTSEGEERLIAWHNTLLKNDEGDITGILSSGEDITERKKTEHKLWFLSTHDSLTGLYNRAYFEEEMKRLERGRQFPVTILMLDVNDLKQVNDKQGHAAGDYVLIHTAQLLKSSFRADEIIARIGGDEFAVLLPKVDYETACNALNRMNEILQSSNALRTGSPLSVSYGIATGERGALLVDILKEADREMYLDKAGKKKN